MTKPKAKSDRGHEKRERLYQTALTLFRERGFDETTMRDIAKAAGASTGSSYYYFASKEALVMEFYRRTSEEAVAENERICAETKDFVERMRALIDFKLEQLTPGRTFLKVFSRYAAEPEHPLSPFSAETGPTRTQAISIIERAIEGSNLKVSDKLRAELPQVGWLMQLSVVLYWLMDESENQADTNNLLDHALPLVKQALSLTTLPLPGVSGLTDSFAKLAPLLMQPLQRQVQLNSATEQES